MRERRSRGGNEGLVGEQNSYWPESKSWRGIGDQATALIGCGYVEYNFVDSETRARYVERLTCNAMNPRSAEATASHIKMNSTCAAASANNSSPTDGLNKKVR